MIKNGLYTHYKGNEYIFSGDMNNNLLIITRNKNIIDESFEDTYHSGTYSKIIDVTELDDLYSISSYAFVDGEKLNVIKEDKDGYIISTGSCVIGQKLNLDRVDKYGYEGWVPKESTTIIEERTPMDLKNYSKHKK